LASLLIIAFKQIARKTLRKKQQDSYFKTGLEMENFKCLAVKIRQNANWKICSHLKIFLECQIVGAITKNIIAILEKLVDLFLSK